MGKKKEKINLKWQLFCITWDLVVFIDHNMCR